MHGMGDDLLKYAGRPKSELHLAVAYATPIGQRVAVVGNIAELGALLPARKWR